MDQPEKNFLSVLIEISKIDAATARMLAEKKKVEQGLSTRMAGFKKTQSECDVRAKLLEEKKQRYQREEKNIKEEREKLILRRKALSSHGNYKVQQAAEREIEHANRQLSSRDEALLTFIDEMDGLEKEFEQLTAQLNTFREGYERDSSDAKAMFVTFEDRGGEYKARRDELVKLVVPAYLSTYERLRERFPMDAITPVIKGSCSSCFIHVVPQLLVEIEKGSSLVRCRGCGRILYVSQEAPKE